MTDIKIVSDEEANEATYAVCVRKGTPTPFTDNVEAICALCGTEIVHRPYLPTGPAKICLECAHERITATEQ